MYTKAENKKFGNNCGRLSDNIMLGFIKLPELARQTYTKSAVYAEKFNAYSHFAGIVLSVFFCGFAFGKIALSPSPAKIISIAVYSLSMVLLYTMSGVYHNLSSCRLKRLFRVLDHSTIFMLIAGCYTPFCAICLWDSPAGRIILSVEWAAAAIGIAMNLRNMSSRFVKAYSQISYLVMGWMIVFAMRLFLERLPLSCLIWLVAGGVCYTVGIIFYALGKRNAVMHCIWHVWVLLGSIFQFISISMIL